MDHPHKWNLTAGCGIRLVDLQPGSWHEEIKCVLVNASLEDEPVYEALSYVCIYDESNLCDASEVFVYLGEVETLSFSSRFKEVPTTRTIFEFSLPDKDKLELFPLRCDKAGRKKRFGRAIGGDFAFEVFCLIRSLAHDSDFSWIPHFDKSSQLDSGPNSNHQRKVFEYLRQFLRAKWWNRVWVIQEVVIPEKVSVMYGSCVAPWSMMVVAGLNCWRNESSPVIQQLPQEYAKVRAHFSRMVLELHKLRQNRRKNEHIDTLSLLRQFGSRAASDDRDKIYALLRLASDGPLFTPDYSLSVAKSFANTTLRMIETSKSLDVLIGNIGRKNRRDLPSWVPDWSTSYDTDNAVWSKSAKIYDASYGISVCLQDTASTKTWSQTWQDYLQLHGESLSGANLVPIRHHHNGMLQLPGRHIGTIKWIGEPYLSSENCHVTLNSWANLVFRFRGSLSDFANLEDLHLVEMQNLLPASTWNSFSRTICAGLFYVDSGNEGWQHRRATETDLEHLLQWWGVPRGTTGKPPPAEVEVAIRLAVTRRRFFITDRGTMGLAPLETCIGDLIFVLPGGDTPFVLRKGQSVKRPLFSRRYTTSNKVTGKSIGLEAFTESYQTHELIGDCYADGFMDGKAVEAWKCDPEIPLCPIKLPDHSQWNSLSTRSEESRDEYELLLTAMELRMIPEKLKRAGEILHIAGDKHQAQEYHFDQLSWDFRLREREHEDTQWGIGEGLLRLDGQNEDRRITQEMLGHEQGSPEYVKLAELKGSLKTRRRKEDIIRKEEKDQREHERSIEDARREKNPDGRYLALSHNSLRERGRQAWDLWAQKWGVEEWARRDQTYDIFLV